jgi:ribonuclease HII
MEDEQYWKTQRPVIGTDEVGRGCLAGPVVACAVMLSPDAPIKAKDSKQLSETQRKVMCHQIEKRADFCVASRSSRYIDAHNILSASLDAMKEAVERLIEKKELDNPIVLVDGNKAIPGLNFDQRTIVKGDQRSLSIAAASVVAKVYRDDYMVLLDRITGNKYAFGKHKGYGTKMHYEAIDTHGPSDMHRSTFRLSGGYKSV